MLSLRSPWGIALLASFLFAAVALVIEAELVSGFDNRILSAVRGWESPGLIAVMEGLSWFGSTTPTIVFCLLMMTVMAFTLSDRRKVLLFAAVMIGSTLLNKALKAVFQRERPELHRFAEETGYSFPSGHAMASFALYGMLIWLLWRRIPGTGGKTALAAVCAVMIVGISLSRICLGVHYPTDLIGGYLASGAWMALCIGVFERRKGNLAFAGRKGIPA